MTGVDEIKRARQAGFTDQEISEGIDAEKAKAVKAGFSTTDVDAYYGAPPFDPKPVKEFLDGNITKPASTFLEALDAGFQSSISGLAVRGKVPDTTLTEDAPRTSRIASMVGQLAGDIPAMVGGAVVGGTASGILAPVGAVAGAFALPAGMRKIMMDKYANGEANTFGDFWDRISGAVIDTAKGWVTGAATGAVGKVIQGAPILSPTLKTAATLTGEVATMTTIGSALEGHAPNANDFIDAAIVLGGVKGSTRVAGKLREIYARTGVKPDEVAADAQHDITVLQDLASENRGIPKRYADALLDQMRIEQRPPPVERRLTGEYVDVAPPPKSLPQLAGDTVVPTVGGPTKAEAFYDPASGPGVARVTPPYAERPAPTPTAQDLVTGRAELDRAKEAETSVLDKNRMFRTAEEILQERSIMKSAEEMISYEPRAKLREKVYILPKGRGPVIDPQDMAEITSELRAKGIVFGEEGKPAWEENIPLDEAQAKILGQIVQHEPGSERLSLSAVYTSIFDNLNPIKKTPGGQQAYGLQRLTRGVMGKASEFLQNGAFDFDNYKSTTRGYTQILEPVKKDLDGFRAYMASKRVVEKSAQGIETGFDLASAKAVVAAGKGTYEAVFQERLTYRDAMLDYLEKAGILNARKVFDIKAANKDYVPFYRFFEEEGQSGRSTSGAVRDPVKQMKGGAQKIDDPIVSDIKDTFLFIALAERNAARREFVKLGGEVATEIRTKSEPLTKKEVAALVDTYGVSEDAAKAIAAIRPSSFRVAANELAVFQDGERVVYKVDPAIAKAFEDVDSVSANLATKFFLHNPSSWLRAGVTLSPEFMGRNIMRDALSAFIYAGSNPVKTVRGGISILTKDTAFHNWLKGGGANATMVAIDRDYIQSHIFKLNAETGIAERAINVMKSPLEVLRVLSEFAENATRVGAVRAEMQTAQTKATIQALSMIAREATVDFGRHGKDTQGLAKSIAFFNPALQGIDRFARAAHANPVAFTAKALVSVTLPSVLLWYANKDDKEIQNLPRWQKDLFWMARVPTGEGSSAIVRIPKAHEIGILFGTLPERMLDAFVKENPDAFKDFERTILRVLLPSMVPTTAVPVVEQFANRSSFTGGPLVPAATEKLLPEYQYNEYTSETAKALGKMFGAFPGMEHAAVANEDMIGGVARALTTPAYIENYVRQWTGGLGMYALQLADQGLRDAGLAPDPVKPASTLADIPVIKAFIARYPSSTAQPIQDFYSNFYVAKRYYDTITTLAKSGDPRAVDLLNAHPDTMVQLDGMRETLTGQSKLVHDINKDPKMTPSDKRQLIDTIYYNMIQIAEAGNEMYRKIGALK